MATRTRRARSADVAREAGVSKTAVSFAFNSPERLSAATAERIREVADGLGYRPHPVARMLAQKNTMTIGLLTPQALSAVFANPFFATLCGGVAAVTDQAGYGLLFVSPLHGSLIRALGRATVDGFVAVGLSEDHPEVEQIRHAGVPMVLVDGDAFPEHGSVESNDEVGARAAARHLLSLGHREFVVVGIEPPNMPDLFEFSPGPTETVASRRLTGYRQGLDLGGIALADERIVVGPATFDGGVAAFRRVWEDEIRPTAILAMSDVMAIGIIWAAREVGLRVPEDLSVVGFDDLDVAPGIDRAHGMDDVGVRKEPHQHDDRVHVAVALLARRFDRRASCDGAGRSLRPGRRERARGTGIQLGRRGHRQRRLP